MKHNEVNLKPLQVALLDIYKAIRAICDRHNLKYFASGGTTLGAVRHGGFIPWDDDLDLEMPRKDYEQFCAVVENELPKGLRFVSLRNTYGYDYLFSKVVCTDAQRVKELEQDTGLQLTQGVFVDIFVADNFPRGCFAQIWRLILRAIIKIKQYNFSCTVGGSSTKQTVSRFCGWIVWPFFRKVKTYFDAVCADDELASRCSDSKSSLMGLSAWFVFDWWRFCGKQQIKSKDYGEMKLVAFENTTIPVQENVETYLKERYGDWRKLPPPEQQCPSHGDGFIASWRYGVGAINKQPILSIVIANFNYGRFIETAIRSIVNQCWGVAVGQNGQTVLGLPNGEAVELIIVDGGSSDNSIEVIKNYSSWLTWWCSENDKGQSDAFNKGFSHASGKFLTWVNADDLMVPGSLMAIVKTILSHPKCEWFTGNFFRFVPSGKITQIGWGPHYYPKVLQRKNSHIVSFGPSTFFSRRIYELAGGMDERFHNTMDTMMWVKFIQMGIKQCRIRKMCWAFRLHDASKTSEFEGHNRDPRLPMQSQKEREIMRLETHYLPSRANHVLLLLWRIVDFSLVWKFVLTLSRRRADQFLGKWREYYG